MEGRYHSFIFEKVARFGNSKIWLHSNHASLKVVVLHVVFLFVGDKQYIFIF